MYQPLPRLLAAGLCLLFIQGCFHTQLNGSVGGAEVTVTELADADKVVATATATSESSLKTKPGEDAWNGWSSFAQLALLGIYVMEPEVDPAGLYLVTAAGGEDADVDLDLQRDAVATAVAGEWHAIMTGAQLTSKDRKISVLSEAVYQSVVAELDDLTDAEILARLDAAAARVIGDENGDGEVDYLDVLAWSRLKDKGELLADLGDLNRLSLAVREGQQETALKGLGNRVMAGPAAVDADDIEAARIVGDGSCEGRSRAVVSGEGESITTVPPSAACDDSDTGYVESSQDDNTGTMSPASNGYIRVLELQGATLKFSDYDNKGGTVKVTATEAGKEPRTVTQSIDSPEKLDSMSNAYQRISALQGASTASDGAAKSTLRKVYGQGGVAGEISASGTVSIAATDSAVGFSDILSYGTLASSWSACMAYQYFSAQLAAGETVPEAAQQWAVKGCTSLLAEVQVWVEESSEQELEAFEASVPEVETEGCSECYAYIVSPAPGLVVKAGSPVVFEGVAPQSSERVEWVFGDGDSDPGRSARHAYAKAGDYTASFEVIYSDGSSSVNQVTVDVRAPGSEESLWVNVGTFSYSRNYGGCSSSGTFVAKLLPGDMVSYTFNEGSQYISGIDPCTYEAGIDGAYPSDGDSTESEIVLRVRSLDPDYLDVTADIRSADSLVITFRYYGLLYVYEVTRIE